MLKTVLTTVFLLLFTAGLGFAAPFQYYCITDNYNNCTALAPQLTIGIAEVSGRPQFTIWNNATIPSSIAGTYWDDDYNLLAGIYLLTGSGPGVVFAPGGTPPLLPGENNAVPPFETDTSLTATAVHPAPVKGINPGESLAIIFDLESGVTYAQVLAAFNSGNLRSGIHVQAIGELGRSDSLVNLTRTDQVIPEPATILLLGSGLIGFWAFRRRFKK